MDQETINELNDLREQLAKLNGNGSGTYIALFSFENVLMWSVDEIPEDIDWDEWCIRDEVVRRAVAKAGVPEDVAWSAEVEIGYANYIVRVDW